MSVVDVSEHHCWQGSLFKVVLPRSKMFFNNKTQKFLEFYSISFSSCFISASFQMQRICTVLKRCRRKRGEEKNINSPFEAFSVVFCDNKKNLFLKMNKFDNLMIKYCLYSNL